jgi:hypothetical protein
MHIPTVTDQMLTKVLEAASSPVAVVFLGGPDRSRNALWRWRMKEIAEDWDASIIFVLLDCTENPTMARSLNALHQHDGFVGLDLPLMIVFRRGEEFGRCLDCARATMEQMFTRCLRVPK